jgi:hypothetical protein
VRYAVNLPRVGVTRVAESDAPIETVVAHVIVRCGRDGGSWPVGTHVAYVSDGDTLRRTEVEVTSSGGDGRGYQVNDAPGPIATNAAAALLAALRAEP